METGGGLSEVLPPPPFAVAAGVEAGAEAGLVNTGLAGSLSPMMVEVRQAASMASARAAPPVLPPASSAATLVSGVRGEGVEEERAGKGSVENEPARDGDELPSWRSSRKMKRERAGCSGS
jgi:hypothetical protein